MRAIFFLVYFLPIVIFSQENTEDDLLKQKIESISENLSNEDTDFSALTDQLNYYRIHPININTASREQLKDLLILNDIQINNLLAHIRKFGNLMSIYELQSVDGFDVQMINLLMHYVTIEDVYTPASKLLSQGANQIDMRWQRVLEQQKGYTSGSGTKYLGSPDKLLFRYRFNSNNKLLFGLNAEKDPGEQFFNVTQKKGFDLYSGYVMLNNKGILRSIIAGDYQLFIGQGLISWTGMAFGKSVDVLNINKSNSLFRPHTSVEENLFLRGAAAAFKLRKFELTAFASYKAFDGNVTDTTVHGETTAVSSLQQTGYHTTTAEMADRHSFIITTFGSDLTYKNHFLNVGVAVMNTGMSAEVRPSVQLYNLYNAPPKQLQHGALHYDLNYRNVNLFGELAFASNRSYAAVSGLLIALDAKVSASVLYRNYAKNYYSLYNNGFAENSKTQNEEGVYAGLQLKPVDKINITAYYDIFSFPWLRYQVNAPSSGYENFVQVNYDLSKKFQVYFRYRRKQREVNSYITQPVDALVSVVQDNIRAHFSYQVYKWLRLSNRAEWVIYNRPDADQTNGFLLYQDVSVRLFKGRASLSMRYALFDSEDYNSRVYAFENDLPYSFSIPSFYNKGARCYLMCSYDITKNVNLWLRYSQTDYTNVNVVSPGTLNEISGNTKSELKVQVQIKF